MRVKEASSNIVDYGFVMPEQGSDITELVDFMVGLDTHQPLELPVVESPSGIPISVNLIPDGDQLVVYISNVTEQAEQRQQLQQAANENQLLLAKQKQLLAELEVASKELETKNTLLEEASRLQTGFLSGVSHEFRTPLTSIIGYTNLVREDLHRINQQFGIEQAGENASYLRAVHRSSKHLLSLVENLLDHGKLDSNEIVVRPKVTDLGEVFDDVDILLRPLGVTKQIEFDVSTNGFPRGLMAVVDDSRLRQCLINLIGNAIKFTDDGSVDVQASWSNDMLRVNICDTGLGIPSEDLEKVRLPFWQGTNTGKAGTGLGLTITEKIINLMGGELSIESTLGEGTTVSFDLPAPLQMDHSTETDLLTTGSLHFLLAEDDSDIASLVSMMLIERGVQVTHVENGALALEALANTKAGLKGMFDLVLMDIHMPIMSGYDAIAAIRASKNDIPVLVMSASAMDNDRTRAEQLGCDGYLVKPVEIDDLLQLAKQVIQSK